jgi:putative DNA primase/helicase
MDVAREFLAKCHGHDVRPTLLRHRGEFFCWSGCHYVPKDEEAARACLYAFLDSVLLADPNGGSRPFEPNRNKVTNVLDALRAQTLVDSTFDTPSWLLPGGDTPALGVISCKNGLLDLAAKSLRPHTPAYFNLSSLPYGYDPGAPEPVNWLKFLDELYADDVWAIRGLQEMFGYMLVPDTSQQKIFMIIGPARSGKGTIARVLTAFLGEHNVIAPTLSSLSGNFGLQGFIGKHAAIVHDARLGNRSDQQVIAERLLSISGEDTQTIDRKFQTEWTGHLPTRFLILSNELPAIADASGALASRFIIFTLQHSFLGQEDRGLTKRLLEELPGVLNWAIEGWASLSKRGHFVQPASSSEAILDLEAATSPIKAFVRDCCTIGPERSVHTDELYQEWRRWCEKSGRDRPGAIQKFGRDLRSALPAVHTSQSRGSDRSRLRVYQGIGIQCSH